MLACCSTPTRHCRKHVVVPPDDSFLDTAAISHRCISPDLKRSHTSNLHKHMRRDSNNPSLTSKWVDRNENGSDISVYLATLPTFLQIVIDAFVTYRG